MVLVNRMFSYIVLLLKLKVAHLFDSHSEVNLKMFSLRLYVYSKTAVWWLFEEL